MAGNLTNNLASIPTDPVSVIMPAFNAEKFIKDAIISVTRQTYPHWELIVIDDGSTDSTAAIVKEYASLDDRIKYVHQENAGQGQARNHGLKVAKGHYVAFLDADDQWLPEMLLTQVKTIFRHKADLVFSDAYVFENSPYPGQTIKISAGFYQGEEAIQKFLLENYVPILTVLAKRSVIEQVKGFSELKDIHEDYHLWIRLLIEGYSFYGLDMPLAYYRVHAGSSSSGEGKMQFLTVNTLQDIGTSRPRYSSLINQSLHRLITDHLATVNINEWDIAKRLLEIRNGLTGEIVSISFWKRVYLLFGKNTFRTLFRLKTKNKPAIVEDKKLKVSII